MDLVGGAAPAPVGNGAASSPVVEATALVDLIATAATELTAVTGGATEWESAPRREVLSVLDRALGVLGVAKGDLLVAEKKSMAWVKDGARTFEEWRGKDSREGRGAARTEVARAETMETLEGGRDAVADGDLTHAHLAELDKVTRGLPTASRKALHTGTGAEKVRRLARKHDARTFGQKLTEEVAKADPRDTERRIEAIRSRRFLRVSHGTDGTRISGLVDPVDGRYLQVALEAAMQRPGADDTRTQDQRTADALVDIARVVLDEGALKKGAHVRPHLSIVFTDETFAAVAAHCGAVPGEPAAVGPGYGASAGAGAVGPGGGVAGAGAVGVAGAGSTDAGADGCGLPPVVAGPVVRLEEGPVLPLPEVERILCSVEITRVVVNAEGEPVNLGREARLYTGRQRRAVLLRDETCAWNGCTMPGRWCEIHHVDWWQADGGETSVDRGVTLCSRHHKLVHSQHLDIARQWPSEADPHQGTLMPSAGTDVRGGGTNLRGGGTGVRGGGGSPRRRVAPGDPDYAPPTYTFTPRADVAGRAA